MHLIYEFRHHSTIFRTEISSWIHFSGLEGEDDFDISMPPYAIPYATLRWSLRGVSSFLQTLTRTKKQRHKLEETIHFTAATF